MSSASLSKVPARTAAEVCKRFALSEAAKPLLRETMAPRAFLDVLLQKGLYPDAIRFLAYALPKREAVWWASQCLRQAGPAGVPQAAAIQAAETWAAAPTEENRRAAQPAADAAGLDSPAGCAALGAFFSGGSLAPPTVAPVPPAEDLTAKCAAGAVLVAAVQKEPEKAAEKYRKFCALGIDVGNGTNRWKEAAAPRATGS
jgi:hypothetical protein